MDSEEPTPITVEQADNGAHPWRQITVERTENGFLVALRPGAFGTPWPRIFNCKDRAEARDMVDTAMAWPHR